ncbi:MAG: DNA replication and repair protein RecF [Crocinitomicaceae bacterium]|nr:DNA replication and repair protein RecF [Crocinitomicaceae bacterium]|tara:strand:- start:493 stop:1599 length:1107 start_codon:yes stop_codon:yes gene_type:complete
MILKSLSLVNFKNYEEAVLEPNSNVNCFIGENGQGKTNVLDAIYYLAFCKSFFNPIDSQNIRHDQSFFVIQGTFVRSKKDENYFCGIKKGQKKQFKRNKKEYEKLSEHIGRIPLVMISPADSFLITDGSESRRKFVDGVIAQFNKSYLDNLLNYQRALSQRNALLKSFAENRNFDADSLAIWNEKLITFGEPIHRERHNFLEEFIPLFQKHYKKITENAENVNLKYSSAMNEKNLQELLEEFLGKDQALRYTTQGIHKDDLTFEIDKYPLKKFGSQGQQKSFVIALKFAQFEFIRLKKGTMPLLLLDDIFDKLDSKRVEAIIEMVSTDDFGQIFITDTNMERIKPILKKIKKAYQLFDVIEGGVQNHE